MYGKGGAVLLASFGVTALSAAAWPTRAGCYCQQQLLYSDDDQLPPQFAPPDNIILLSIDIHSTTPKSLLIYRHVEDFKDVAFSCSEWNMHIFAQKGFFNV
ncbi:hypothetical protein Y032_0012g1840 [Ancylostoma ceylanicum]|uniref:Secreted protein n=1 Tax=Ancylostoma ceylanicum TaxID=53326 RepID=A0A016VE88_9BILA|nr:hypothetical protein Y032_0012g1840 [Ancylostoma ceylanicum]